jgi:hypothetical protein
MGLEFNYQKSHDPKQYFLSPFEGPPTGQPYIESLVLIAIAVSRMTPLASSVELREGPHSLPSFPGYLPFLSVPFLSKHHSLRLAEHASARAVLRYSPILIPKPLSSSFPTNSSLLYGQSAS